MIDDSPMLPRSIETVENVFRPQYITLICGFIYLSSFILTYSFYFFQGRWNGYFPTVSESAIENINSSVFIAFMALESVVILVIMHLYSYFKGLNGDYSKIPILIAYFCFIALNTISNCTIEDYHVLHSYSASSLFSTLYLYLTYETFTHKTNNKFIYKTRVAIIIGSFIVFIGAVFKLRFLDFSYQMTVHAVCEVLFLFSVIAVLVTWFDEFKRIRIDLEICF